MNPAVLNYLQAQQSNQQQEGQNQAPFNPFDSGIRNAIESARVSLDMTEKQQDKALRRSMLTFANNYAAEPRQRGLRANFGSVAKALSPAIIAHDDSEDMAFKENNALANQILAYQGADQDRASREEEKQFRRNQAQEQLAEQRRYHNMMSDYQNKKLNMMNQQEIGTVSAFGDEYIPIQSKSELAPHLKAKSAMGSVLRGTEEIEKAFAKLRKKHKDNVFDPMSPVSGIVNPVKNHLGRFLNNKKLREESNDLAAFNSLLNEYVSASERDLKGGGSSGPQILQYFQDQKIYPSLTDDNPELFETKLKAIKHKIEDGYKAANLSLKYKLHIDPSQVERFESILNKPKDEIPQEGNNEPPQTPENNPNPTLTNTNEQDFSSKYNVYIGKKGIPVVAMHDASGEEFEVPPERVEDAKKIKKLIISDGE